MGRKRKKEIDKELLRVEQLSDELFTYAGLDITAEFAKYLIEQCLWMKSEVRYENCEPIYFFKIDMLKELIRRNLINIDKEKERFAKEIIEKKEEEETAKKRNEEELNEKFITLKSVLKHKTIT